jgi:TolB-like protein
MLFRFAGPEVASVPPGQPKKGEFPMSIFQKIILVPLALWLGTSHSFAQTLDKEIANLAASLSKALVLQGSKNVAAIDFTDLQGQPSELGRFLSEQLTLEMVTVAGVSMLDRANIKSILSEHKLTEAGLVNPANAKKLGEFAGVDAILIGTVTELDSGIILTVKAISTESAKILAAGRATFPTTSDIQQLLNRSVSAKDALSPPTTNSPLGGSASYQNATAIATKDIGSLRVVLKSITPGTQVNPYTRQLPTIKATFELISRETQRPLLVGINATQTRGYNRGDCRLGQGLRASALDSLGISYELENENVTGVSIIGVGCDDMKGYDPSQIVSLLETQDKKGNRGQQLGEYVYGAMSQIAPGKSIDVSVTFTARDKFAKSTSRPEFLDLSSEFVVGVVGTDSKKTYSLHNVIFDRISLSKF